MTRVLSVIVLVIAIAGFPRTAGATSCVEISRVLRSSRLAGQVFDRDGAPLPGALVTITLFSDHVIEIETDEHGYFEAPDYTPSRGYVAVSLLGFESTQVWFELDEGLPFQLLAVTLGFGMTCDSRSCGVLLPSPTFLTKVPRCLTESVWASENRKWASTTRGFDRNATRCTAGNQGACRSLARTAARDKDERKRAYAAQVLTDQRLLADLARSASDARVRVTAAGNLTDQGVAAALAEGDQDDAVRAAAVGRLTDAALLERFARFDAIAFVRAVAAGSSSLTVESVLRACALRDPSAEVRRAALANPNMSDQVFLAEVASGGDDPNVRSAAARKLDDPDRLRTLARGDGHFWVRMAAVSNPALRDDALFADIAKEDPHPSVRSAALARISDPILRGRVAPYVSGDVTDEVTDPAVLVDLANNAKEPRVRAVAVSKIVDERQIIDILRREKDESVRYSALANDALTDQQVLTDIALHDPTPGVRVVAAWKLDDQTLAQPVYEEALRTNAFGRWLWGDLAVRKLTDRALLATIALTDPDSSVRSAAVWRLEDQEVLTRVALTDPDVQIRMTAVRKLTDTALLSRISKDDADWWVRRDAQDRLKELRRRRQP